MTGSPPPEPPLEILEALRHPVPVEESSTFEASRRASIDAMVRAMESENGHGKRRARRLAMCVAAAAILLGGVGFVRVLRTGQDRSVISRVMPPPGEGGSELRVTAGLVAATHDGKPVAVPVGSVVLVKRGDEIQSAADGEARLSLPRGVHVEIGGSTKAQVLAVSELEQRLRCDLGTTRVSVPKPGGPRTFAIETPDAEVIVHGTEFSVLVERGDSSASTVTSVAVTRGAVLVVYRGEQRLIAAGDHWSSRVLPPVVSALPSAEVRMESPAPVPANRAGVPTGSGRGSLAEQNRLFRAALDARKIGDDARAVAYLDELLTQFPNTTLAHEARLARARAVQRREQASETQRDKN